MGSGKGLFQGLKNSGVTFAGHVQFLLLAKVYVGGVKPVCMHHSKKILLKGTLSWRSNIRHTIKNFLVVNQRKFEAITGL